MTQRGLRVAVLAAVVGAWVASGCDASCGDTSVEPQPESWIERIPGGERVARRAPTAAFAPRASNVSELSALVDGTTPPVALVGALLRDSDTSDLVDAQAPAAMFRGDRWGALIPLRDVKGASRPVRAHLEQLDGWSVSSAEPGLRVTAPSGAHADERVDWGVVEIDDYLAVVQLGSAGGKLPEGAAPDVLSAVGLSTSDRRAESRRRRLLEELSADDGALVGWVDPSARLERVGARDRAETLIERLGRQIGTVAFRVVPRDDCGSDSCQLDGQLRLVGASGVPRIVEGLGRPDSELSDRSRELRSDDDLGLVRISVDPEKLYRLVRSGTPPEIRRMLEGYWQRAEQRLAVEHPRELAGAVSGHALVAVSELQLDQLELGWEGLHALLTLGATRETVLLPLDEPRRVERALDAATQLSGGRLTRSSHDGLAEYAWLDDGELKWALLLGDRALVYADSAGGVERARRLVSADPSVDGDEPDGESGPGPPDRELMQARGRSGLYLDGSRLERVLDRAGVDLPFAARWTIESALVVAGIDGESSRMDVRLKLGGRQPREGPE